MQSSALSRVIVPLEIVTALPPFKLLVLVSSELVSKDISWKPKDCVCSLALVLPPPETISTAPPLISRFVSAEIPSSPLVTLTVPPLIFTKPFSASSEAVDLIPSPAEFTVISPSVIVTLSFPITPLSAAETAIVPPSISSLSLQFTAFL